ncbi:hypothetical protein [Nocardioides sp. Soil805]|uniref:hypothetical protein n=1 Tax=Nocardioides sp. Soil805 TaxID=1736416 RepID=UPI0007038E61|nr:hypothetical protein [Nocardioides sp. Soil805]KRF36955.1 hypothetical protein ASG94_06075 [Nocardioides sp. Soil805]
MVATLRPGESLDHLLTAADHAHMQQSLDAAARGDAQTAWEQHMSGLVVEESLTHHRLHELVLLGDDAPAWMYSRWAMDQAALWMLHTKDPRCDDLVRLVLAALHTDRVAALADDPRALREYGTMIAATDWAYQQVAVFEAGGLRDFVDVRAEGGLMDRTDELDLWEQAAVTAYELETTLEGTLRVRRLADDTTVELLNLGAATDIGLGRTVLGRVVPVSVWPFAMFASRPLPVDRATALDAAQHLEEEDGLGWLWALSRAHDAGRLPAGSTWGHGTLYSTDLLPMDDVADPDRAAQPGRMRDLLDVGLSEQLANGVCVAEVALIAARVSPTGASAVAPHLAAVLMDPRVHEALRAHAVRPGEAPQWETLAAVTPSPVRERCLDLARLCEVRDAS